MLGFSYNAFSYDLFNYIFDAKIVTFYHQNPYFQKALDYPVDPMLSFMHWTHRVYPYGPVWLALTVPLSFIGFQFFLPTFFLYKALTALSFLGAIFFIGKILKKTSRNDLLGIVFFGLNPLLIIESLVSAHNDIVMMFLALAGFYFLIEKKYLFAFTLIALSIGVKFATIFLIPPIIIVLIYQWQKKEIPWNKIWFLSFISMTFAVVFASLRTNFQPWYLIMVLPFVTLIEKKYYIYIPVFIISLFSLLQYVPFLYLGNWNYPVPNVLYQISVSSIILSVIFTLFYFLKISLAKKKIK